MTELASLRAPSARAWWWHRSILLAFVMIAAALLRLAGIRYGLPALNDPDELIFELGSVKLLREQTLNPGWFGHPATTLIYALAVLNAGIYAIGLLAGWFSGPAQFSTMTAADPSWVILPGRLLILLLGVACVGLTYRLGKLLFGTASGLAAAALLALSPLHIVMSQVIRADMLATCFMLLCLCAAVRIARGGARGDYLKASLWLGLAIASKWPFVASGIGVAGAGLLYALRHADMRLATVRNLLMFSLAAFAVLFLVSPYLLLDYPTVLRNLNGEGQVRHLGATGGGLAYNIWWYLHVPLFSGLGAAGLALAAGGMVATARNPEVRAVIFPTLFGFLLLIASQNLVWQRWALPLLPLLAVVAGVAAVWLVRWLCERFGKTTAIAAGAAVVALVGIPLATSAAAGARERSNDTRQQASRWAIRAIPAGSTVLVEHFAFDLVPRPWHFLFPLGEAGCVDGRWLIDGSKQYRDIDRQRNGRSNLDLGTIPPTLLGSCRADYAILTHYDRYAAERQAFPNEYASYRRLLASGTIVATFRPEPGTVGGYVVRVVQFHHGKLPGNANPSHSRPRSSSDMPGHVQTEGS